MDISDILVTTPPVPLDPALAIAACRAGAIGVLDLEHAAAEAEALAALTKLEHFTSSPFGVKLGRDSAEIAERVLQFAQGQGGFQRLGWVQLAGGDHRQLRDWVRLFKQAGCTVVLEAISLAEIKLGEELGADGLVLKGQEAGGRVGDDTAFILVQRWHARRRRDGGGLPVWVQGGIGLNTAAACVAAGAAGIVLDAQLSLARESGLSEVERARLASFDGSETVCIGGRLGAGFRVYSRPKLPAVAELLHEEERIAASEQSAQEKHEAWRQTVRKLVLGPLGAADERLWLLGQDAALARPLAERYVTVSGILQAIQQRIDHHLQAAQRLKPLAEGAPLAVQHRTRYPLVQGPMTRVSDTAAFADAVAGGGALPFLALALLRGPESAKLLAETKERLGDRSWGVGILGFVPAEIRQEQIAAIKQHLPPFALIAGGRPDQAHELEADGIVTYLHVPSPELLRLFLKNGATKFVFEGRECGGHVGPRTSFVLWETMCEVLLEHLGTRGSGADLHVIFAGGIHDALSGAMVSALSASLAERGVNVGALLGTAYLFTQEAVDSGAIVARFQHEALHCAETVLMQSGPGHAIRCIRTPYYDVFETERRQLQRDGASQEEITRSLEMMNIGRLRVASKGVDWASGTGSSTGPAKYVTLSEDEQYDRGMYMIGQVATMRDRVVRIAELHDDICTQGTALLELSAVSVQTGDGREPTGPVTGRGRPCDVAIIGMACFLPRAGSVRAYWENILHKVDAVTEVPATHWDWRLYYDPDPRARDKIISKWGGFIDDVPFDPFVYGITPNSVPAVEPLQLIVLESVRRALADAGYADRPFNRERTCAILGVGGSSPLAVSYGLRTCIPMFDTVPGLEGHAAELSRKTVPLLPEWTEDSFPGILVNVAAGRVANRFNFGGTNYAIDAACGSSLAAVQACIQELEMGTSDVAVAMGADTAMTPFAYVAFSKTHALSPKGRCKPFDASADGIVLSEGMGAVILKRLDDAERDGDRIYAVIRGTGSSSDGRDKGLTAPRAEGQLRALRRAYAKAGISPADVGLVEAHGTGTVVGDQTEAQALGTLWQEAGAVPQSCALGSVKSMIGHAKCAAGLAGLIKTTLALYHQVLPPTLLETPNPRGNFESGPLYLNTEARPWVHDSAEPRRAGVSAFGFGGTNYHIVLEEYKRSFLAPPGSAWDTWPAELLVWRRPNRAALVEAVEQCRQSLAGGARPALARLAAALWKACPADADQAILAVVAASHADLQEKLDVALAALRSSQDALHDPRGIFFAQQPAGAQIAFLFPGQGSQYPNMLAQIAMAFPVVRQLFDRATHVLNDCLDKPLGRYVFPPSWFSPEQEKASRQELARTDVAQPAIGAASLAMFRLLGQLGVEPDFLAGHSYGELVALCAGGAVAEADLFRLSFRRGQVIRAAAGPNSGTMAAVEANPHTVRALLTGFKDVVIANFNSPRQTVVSGTEEGVLAVLEGLKGRGLRGQRLPVPCAFHSPLIEGARVGLAEFLARCNFDVLRRPVFANTTAAPYPAEPQAMAALLTQHLTAPVRFQEQIEAMYAAGARLFIEVGPNGVLTGLVNQILAGRPFLAVPSDLIPHPTLSPRGGEGRVRGGLTQLLHLLASLLVHKVPVQLAPLFQGRELQPLDLNRLASEMGQESLSPSTWLVNSFRSRPLSAPEARLIGQGNPAQPLPAPVPVPWGNGQESGARSQQSEVRNQGIGVNDPMSNSVNGSFGLVQSSARGDLAAVEASNGAPVDEAAQLMLRFQEVMGRFLETQKSVMNSYLQGGLGTPPSLLPAVLPLNGIHENGSYGPATSAEPEDSSAPAQTSGAQAAAPAGPVPSSEVLPAKQAPKIDEAWAANKLLELVGERTGYPREMLKLDMDMEADLGIDSIKRVEILGSLAEALGQGDNAEAAANLQMEKLASIRTLRGILAYLGQALAAPSPSSSAMPAETVASPPIPQVEIQRGLIELVDAPLAAAALPSLPGGTIVFTDDGRGIAREMACRLGDLGQKCVFLHTGSFAGNGQADVFHADLTDPAAVAELAQRLRQEIGSISGLVHLLPLAVPPEGETSMARMEREVKSLYLLARALEEDLRRNGKQDGAVLLAATSMGGRLGFEAAALPEDFFAGHGGVAGFVKCLANEWPEVLVRAVDTDGTETPATLAKHLLRELSDRTGPPEVGVAHSRRVTWEPLAAPLEPDPDAAPLLDADSTVLITGGARGITAAVALELARRYRPNLVIVGRSPLPAEQEADDTADLTTGQSIKSALIARLQRQGRSAAPAAVESAYQRLMQDREIRANLAALRRAGAAVHYHPVDVRNEQPMASLLREIERKFGRLDGVIHGAGVIEDRLVRDKTPESFDRVFGTKVQSALILRRHLKPEQLKFCVFFASIASRFGNKGQSDYAAANEVLSKMAVELDRLWPCRVLSVAWGPWSGIGMVAGLAKHLVQRGLKLIDPEVGPVFLVDELAYGRKGDCEVIIAGGAEHLVRPGGAQKLEPSLAAP